METYRSGHTEPHSKCGCQGNLARGFESHRFRHYKKSALLLILPFGKSYAL